MVCGLMFRQVPSHRKSVDLVLLQNTRSAPEVDVQLNLDDLSNWEKPCKPESKGRVYMDLSRGGSSRESARST